MHILLQTTKKGSGFRRILPFCRIKTAEGKASGPFNPLDPRDRVILALTTLIRFRSKGREKFFCRKTFLREKQGKMEPSNKKTKEKDGKERTMLNAEILVKIEEYLNNHPLLKTGGITTEKIDPRIKRAVEEIESGQESLYEFLCRWLEKRHWVKKSGKLDEGGFYKYAMIDKNTWSNIRWSIGFPSKETLLKLIIALRLNEQEAQVLMRKGSGALNPLDPRDRVILALIDIKCYDIDDVYEVLEEYGKHPAKPEDAFNNIYSFQE